MLGKGKNHNDVDGNMQLNKETKVSYNRDNCDSVSMNNNSNPNSGIEATNSNCQKACSGTMDEFRAEGIVMLSKIEENG